MRILQNQVRCDKCGDEPYSAYRHDFKYCKCESIAVDGGMDYLRRLGNSDNYTEMSVSVTGKVYRELEKILLTKDMFGDDTDLIDEVFFILMNNNYRISRPSDKVYSELMKALWWAEDTERNELGTICAIFRVLRDNNYDLTPTEREEDEK